METNCRHSDYSLLYFDSTSFNALDASGESLEAVMSVTAINGP